VTERRQGLRPLIDYDPSQWAPVALIKNFHSCNSCPQVFAAAVRRVTWPFVMSRDECWMLRSVSEDFAGAIFTWSPKIRLPLVLLITCPVIYFHRHFPEKCGHLLFESSALLPSTNQHYGVQLSAYCLPEKGSQEGRNITHSPWRWQIHYVPKGWIIFSTGCDLFPKFDVVHCTYLDWFSSVADLLYCRWNT
jgi:hypothetical protein